MPRYALASPILWSVFDVATHRIEAAELEQRTSSPDFWHDSLKAQDIMRRLAELKDTVQVWDDLDRDAATTAELCDLLLGDEDASQQQQLSDDIRTLADRLAKQEFQLTFQGPYDGRDAILAIHAGEGGTESQDWAQMLLRMYLRWAERKGFEANVLDTSPGGEAGIKSATVEVKGRRVYGHLKAERGVHRLVRLSPFDADHARHTSFAKVEAMPQVEKDIDIEIDQDDLRIDYFKASGAGGQSVQKNSTAVRIVHQPSGITVSVQNERSQRQNRETAMKILMARLMEVELEKRAEEQAKLKGKNISAGFSNQIRSYVLHPYKLIKDHRTGFENRNPNDVLDGNLDDLIASYLAQSVGQGEDN